VRRRVARGGRTWDDLIKPGVEVIEPNPFTSGGAKPPGLFTIKDLGGWSDVNKRFFDKEAGIVADIERTVGVSVGS
jgi:ABC-type sulfate transport system substrate-binding protein